MLQILVLAALVAAAWKLAAPTGKFVDGFARLLETPVHLRPGGLRRLAGTRSVGGERAGRPVTLVVQPKRNRSLGYLIIGMGVAAASRWSLRSRAFAGAWRSIIGAESSSVNVLDGLVVSGDDDRVRESMAQPDVRRSVDALVREHGLVLALEDGWLKVTWMPVGFFVFPGAFDEQKWRDILAHMQTLAASLEARSPRIA